MTWGSKRGPSYCEPSTLPLEQSVNLQFIFPCGKLYTSINSKVCFADDELGPSVIPS